MPMNLVPDWRQSWKWLSLHITSVIVALNGLQAASYHLFGILSAQQIGAINATLGVLVVIARLIDQPHA